MAIVQRQKRKRIWVDTSNIIYTAFYSCWKYYCEEFDIDKSTITETYEVGGERIFQRLFEKKFMTVIESASREFTNYFKWEDVWLCMDCKRDEIWRRKHLPTYKGDRDDKKKKYSPYQGSWKLMYEFINDHLLPALAEERGCRIIRVDNAECDDIIGVAMSRMKDDNNIIISSDHDYIQLSAKAMIVSPQGESTLKKSLAGMEKKFSGMATFDKTVLPTLLEKCKDPEVQLDIKILVGDSSDCIPQVFPRHGPLSKAMSKLILDPEYRAKMFEGDPGAQKRYDFNKYMIDMRMIPKDIQRNILIQLKVGLDRVFHG